MHDNPAQRYPGSEGTSPQPANLNEMLATMGTAEKFGLWLQLGGELGLADPRAEVVDLGRAGQIIGAKLAGIELHLDYQSVDRAAAVTGPADVAPSIMASAEDVTPPAAGKREKSGEGQTNAQVLRSIFRKLPVTLHFIDGEGDSSVLQNDKADDAESVSKAKLKARSTRGDWPVVDWSTVTAGEAVEARDAPLGMITTSPESQDSHMDEETPEVLIVTPLEGKTYGDYTGDTEHKRANEPAVSIDYAVFGSKKVAGMPVGMTAVVPERVARALLQESRTATPSLVRTLIADFLKGTRPADAREYGRAAPDYAYMDKSHTGMYLVSTMEERAFEGTVYPGGKAPKPSPSPR